MEKSSKSPKKTSRFPAHPVVSKDSATFAEYRISASKTEANVGSDWKSLPMPARGTLEFLEHLQEGVSAELALFLAANLELSKESMAKLIGMNIRTFDRRIARGELLDPAASEKILYIKSIHDELGSYFQDHAKAKRWLKEPKKIFNDKPPLDLLNTFTGAEMVLNVINKMKHGYPA